jgi:hypothetical protein
MHIIVHDDTVYVSEQLGRGPGMTDGALLEVAAAVAT